MTTTTTGDRPERGWQTDCTRPEAAGRDCPEVLLVEDDALAALSLSAELAGLGYRVMGPAASAVEALDLIETRRPDAAVLDIRLPPIDGLVFDGLTLAELLQKAYDVPAVVITGDRAAEADRRLRAVGVFGFLIKPVTGPRVRCAVETAMAAHERLRSLRRGLDALRRHALREFPPSGSA
jgi:CheY-like chemotaxis protein